MLLALNLLLIFNNNLVLLSLFFVIVVHPSFNLKSDYLFEKEGNTFIYGLNEGFNVFIQVSLIFVRIRIE